MTKRRVYRFRKTNLTDGAADNVFSVTIPTNLDMASGSFKWSVHASDGVDMQEARGDGAWCASRKGGTVAVQGTAQQLAIHQTASTLTVGSWTFTGGAGTTFTVGVTATSALATTSMIIEIETNSGGPFKVTML